MLAYGDSFLLYLGIGLPYFFVQSDNSIPPGKIFPFRFT